MGLLGVRGVQMEGGEWGAYGVRCFDAGIVEKRGRIGDGREGGYGVLYIEGCGTYHVVTSRGRGS